MWCSADRKIIWDLNDAIHGMLSSSCTLAFINLSAEKHELNPDTHRAEIILDFFGYFQNNVVSAQNT